MATCVEAGIDPLIATGRESHHLPWQGSQGQGVALLGAPRMQRFGEPPPLGEAADAVERMRHRLKTRAGRASYGKRKQTVEPVFGIIKAGMRFRQFLLRGLEAVRGEWSLVTMAWNIRRMAVLKG